MRSIRTRGSFKRSLCGLLAVLMSLKGVAVAGSALVVSMPAPDAAPIAVAADAAVMPCDDVAARSTGSVSNEYCDGACRDQSEGCGMTFCLVGSCLPATSPTTHGVPHALVSASEFPPPVLGMIAAAQGPPLRPPIA